MPGGHVVRKRSLLEHKAAGDKIRARNLELGQQWNRKVAVLRVTVVEGDRHAQTRVAARANATLHIRQRHKLGLLFQPQHLPPERLARTGPEVGRTVGHAMIEQHDQRQLPRAASDAATSSDTAATRGNTGSLARASTKAWGNLLNQMQKYE